LTAYRAWADAILNEADFTNKKEEELLHYYHVHHDAVGTVAEGRWYGFQFLKKIIEDIKAPDSLIKAAQCFDDQYTIMWEMWNLVGGPGISAKQARLFADIDIRRKTADLILEAQCKQNEAADLIEQSLKSWKL